MWKWVLMWVGVVVVLAVFAFTMYAVADPQGLADFFITWDEEIDIHVDGERVEAKINKFEEGLGPADRGYLVKKMLVLYARRLQDSENTQYWQDYNRVLAQAAEDHKLTREENTRLREMFKEIVSEKDVENWMGEFRKLDKSHKRFDPDEGKR